MLVKNLTNLAIITATWLTLSGCSSTPAYAPSSQLQEGSRSDITSIAQSMIGVRYKYGGRSPKTGFDCSGLVYYSHLRAGKNIPRTSQAQYRASKPVPRNRLKQGDLVFFRIEPNKVSHVGIYLGKGRFVHAPSSGKKVTVGTMDNPYWQQRFVRGGRIF